jgi:myosin protein heavy chain
LNHGTYVAEDGSNPSTSTSLHPALIPKFKKARQNLADAAAQAEWAAKKWMWCPDEQLGYVAGWVVSEDTDKETCTVACVDDKV